ncbi:MAG: hypothetical protein GX142_10190 [Chloroflexi bacterium]|jgi:signal peptidase I|nr:hypothetical protein [Chloroflexota bacterium]
MVRLLRVRGSSLWPDFHEGDYVLAASINTLGRKIKPGDVIVFQQPGYGTLLKRVQQVLEGGQSFIVRGTQITSSDSRNFGQVPLERVWGKVIWHIRKHST